jgi:hypothetical protein
MEQFLWLMGKEEVLGRTNLLLSFHYILGASYHTDSIANTASKVLLLLHVHSLPWKSVYGAVVQQ